VVESPAQGRGVCPEPEFLAVEGGGVIGMAQCWTSAFVKDVAVHPPARWRGVGRALMAAAFYAFGGRGATKVDLEVREESTGTMSLCHSLRMQTVARERG